VGRGEVICDRCGEDLDIDRLLTGFAAAGDGAGLRDAVGEALGRLEQIAASVSQVSQAAGVILRAMDAEGRDGPRLFTLLPEDLSRGDPRNIGLVGYRLTLWCEHPDARHPCCRIGTGASGASGEYTFRRPRPWLVAVAPYAKLVGKLLKAAVPVAGSLAKVGLDESLVKGVETTLAAMEKVVDPLAAQADQARGGPDPEPGGLTAAQGAGLREFRALFADLDKARSWAGLRRVRTESGDYLWMCENHYRLYKPGLPRMGPDRPDPA
jgi:internalin A